MKMRFAALAAVLVVSSVGCTAMKPGCGDACGPCTEMPCHIATSQNAPRPGLLQGRCGGCGLGLCDRLGWTQKGCAECVEGCGDYCGPFGRTCCGGPCGQNGLNGALGALLDCDGCNGCSDQNYNFQPGPPVGQVAYPYYTTRGPRDFLMCNPPSIGPR